MRREFDPFDKEVIDDEFGQLEEKHEAALLAVMRLFEESPYRASRPVYIEDLGGGILEIRHTSGIYQGRCLYYISASSKDFQKLTILVAYKKESHRTPGRILKLARKRKEEHELR